MLLRRISAFLRDSKGRYLVVAVILALTCVLVTAAAQPEKETKDLQAMADSSSEVMEVRETRDEPAALGTAVDSGRDEPAVLGTAIDNGRDEAEEDQAGDEEDEEAEYVTDTVEEVIPHTVDTVYTSLIGNGKTKLVREGANGFRTATYSHKIVDGEIIESEVVSASVTQNPVSEKVLVGQKGAPISPLDFGYEFDDDGAPIGYTSVLTNCKATGYSARAGALTASGRKAVVGTCAVNPKVIPYGTKLYIASADGSFVYGYCIAADTGTSMLNGTIDVDLFYETYDESCLNSLRTVNIYILD